MIRLLGFCMLLAASTAAVHAQSAIDSKTVNERVSVSKLPDRVEAGIPFAISLVLSGPPVISAVANWSFYDPAFKQMVPLADETRPVAILRRQDGSPYVNVVAPQVGSGELNLHLNFNDNTAIKTVPLNVEVSKRVPAKFTAGIGSNSATMNDRFTFLDLGTRNSAKIKSYATYTDLPHPVLIPASAVTYKVVERPGDPAPAEIDSKTGTLRALQNGRAIVESSFAGMTSRTCVIVRQNAETGPQANCDDIPGKDKMDAEGYTGPTVGVSKSSAAKH